VKKITINWERAELSPEKTLKVEGKLLLDLRAKIKELERELTKNQEELEKTKEELKETHHKLRPRRTREN